MISWVIHIYGMYIVFFFRPGCIYLQIARTTSFPFRGFIYMNHKYIDSIYSHLGSIPLRAKANATYSYSEVVFNHVAYT